MKKIGEAKKRVRDGYWGKLTSILSSWTSPSEIGHHHRPQFWQIYPKVHWNVLLTSWFAWLSSS